MTPRDPYTGEHIRPSRRRPIAAALVALAVLAGAFLIRQAFAPAADPSVLSVVEECQQALGYPARSSADKTWLRTCIHALTPPTVSPSGSPTPTVPPTATPTPTPTTPSPTPTTPSPTPTTPSPTPTSTSASPTPTPTSTGCQVAGKNVPGGQDPWGGCWPGPGNTGVSAGTVLTDYTGPCSITVAGTVIDSKTVTCSSLLINTTGVLIKNSLLQDVDLDNGSIPNSSFVIVDSTVVNGAREQCGCVAGHDFSALRIEVRGGNRSSYCIDTCTIQDSWLHGQQLEGAQHGSGLREEANTTAVHSSITCDWPTPNDVTSLGCSAALTGYPDYAPIHNNTIHRVLFVASPAASFCAYGGATNGKPFSSDPANGTNQVFTENVFQRGLPGYSTGLRRCADYGPITDFATNRTGNVWSGNVWDDGTVVNPG